MRLRAHSRPVILSGPLPVGNDCPYPGYTDLEHEIWRRLFTRQEQILPVRAADEFLAGVRALELERRRIPSLTEVSRQLKRLTNWRLARAPGLLDAGDFFAHLAMRIFPCTDFIRPGHELDHYQGPDCFRDLFGRAPMLAHPSFADFYQKIGRAALHCQKPATLDGLARIYRFTAEFGMIETTGGLRAYGADIISSASETERSLSERVRVGLFVIDAVTRIPDDNGLVPRDLFAIRSFVELEESFDAWCVQQELL